MLTTFIEQEKVSSLQALKEVIRIFPITKTSVEKFFNIIELLIISGKTKNRYNLSKYVLNGYLILLNQNIIKSKEVLDKITQEEKASIEETIRLEPEESKSKAISIFMGLDGLYDSSVAEDVWREQQTTNLPTIKIRTLNTFLEKTKQEMSIEKWIANEKQSPGTRTPQIVHCIRYWKELKHSPVSPEDKEKYIQGLWEVYKIHDKLRVNKLRESEISSTDKKANTILETFEIAKVIIKKQRDDEKWLFQTLHTRLFE